MPPAKDRQNSGISVLEKEQAAEKLSAALSALDSIDQWEGFVAVARNEIRAAMALLGMEES